MNYSVNVTEKECNRCKRIKPSDQFWTNKRNKTGLDSWCKECHKERGTIYRREKRDNNPEWKERDNETARRYKKTEKWKKHKQAWYYSEKGKEHQKKYQSTDTYKERMRQYVNNNRQKVRAHWTVNKAVKTGKFPPISTQTCANCGKPAKHYHHESYKKEDRLKVIPLCAICHSARH